MVYDTSFMSVASSGPAPGRRRRVRRDALANRERILTAAAETMSQRGHNVPMSEIAEAAGVGIGTLYRGYPDRTALLHALEHRAYDLLIDILDRIEISGQSGADAIETYLVEGLKLGNQLVLPLRGAPPLVDASSVAARQRINAYLEKFLAGGRAKGTVRHDVNTTDVIVCGAMTTQPLPHSPAWMITARRHITLFTEGIRAQTGTPLPGPPITPRDVETTFGQHTTH